MTGEIRRQTKNAPWNELTGRGGKKGGKDMSNLKFIVLSFVLLFSVSTAGAQDNLMKKAQMRFKTIPKTVPEMKGKTFTPQKVELGKMLYFEPRLSASALISCNTCHNVGMGGADFQETSVGHRWQKGPRNAPTVLNSVFNRGPEATGKRSCSGISRNEQYPRNGDQNIEEYARIRCAIQEGFPRSA